MKVSKYQTSMVLDIVDHMKEKGLDELTAGYLRFVLEDSIIMNIIVDDKLYQTPFKYWLAYREAYGSCCGSCNEDTLYELEIAKKELLKNSTEIQKHALDY